MTSILDSVLNPPVVDVPAPVLEAEGSYPYLVYTSNDEKERLEAAINTLKKSKIGQELLNDAAEYGTKISFENMSSAHGSFCDDDNIIRLNPSSGANSFPFDPEAAPNRVIATLAHELRHAQQFKNGVQLDALLDLPKNYINSQRTIEADANATAAAATWELKEQGISKPFELLKADGRIFIEPFEKEAEKGGVKTGEAQKAGFYAWFNDTSLLDAYEDNYLRNYSRNKDKASREKQELALRRDIPVMDTVVKSCTYDGKSYLGEEAEEFFASPERLTVKKDTYYAIYRNVRDMKRLGWDKTAEEVMLEEGGFSERMASDWYYDMPPTKESIQSIADKQKEMASKIKERKYLDEMKKSDIQRPSVPLNVKNNGTKHSDIAKAVLDRKRTFLGK